MIYLRQGQYKSALKEILNILGPNPKSLHCADTMCEGCLWERKEAIYTAMAVLGYPVPRQKCKYCGSLDQIWARHDEPFKCHAPGCGKTITDMDFEWVEEPADKKETKETKNV